MIDYNEFKKQYPNPRIWRLSGCPNFGFTFINKLEFSCEKYSVLSDLLLKESRKNNPENWIKYI